MVLYIKDKLQMKKTFSFISILTVSMALIVGCSSEKTTYEDGVYSKESAFDERGWKSTLTLTVENGKIKEVDYDEVDNEGASKTTDAEYAKAMKDEEGVTPKEAFEKLEKELISSQDIDEVDAVSGATTSSEVFKKLTKDALGL